MAQIVVRDIDDDVKAKIKQRAEKRGCSMEEEVRRILRDAAKDSARPTVRLGSRIASLFSATGLKEDLPELRGQSPRPLSLKS